MWIWICSPQALSLCSVFPTVYQKMSLPPWHLAHNMSKLNLLLFPTHTPTLASVPNLSQWHHPLPRYLSQKRKSHPRYHPPTREPCWFYFLNFLQFNYQASLARKSYERLPQSSSLRMARQQQKRKMSIPLNTKCRKTGYLGGWWWKPIGGGLSL